MIYCLNIKASLFICKRLQLEYKMTQNRANKHLFGITDVNFFFFLTDRDGEMTSESKMRERMSENKRERMRERMYEKEREK